jgi:lysophospholipase L1-like esterase
LNAEDGSITSSMAIISSTNGSIDAFASSDTQLILDVSGYFASPPGPTVVILGDSIVNAWLTPAVLAANPQWTVQGSPAGVAYETTTQVLAREPQALALHPDILVLEVGTWDMNIPGQIGDFCVSVPQPCHNVVYMINLAQAAGAYVIVCTIPPWGNGPAATSLANDQPVTTNMGRYNYYLYYAGHGNSGDPAVTNPNAVASVDMYGVLANVTNWWSPGPPLITFDPYVPAYTSDGLNPSAAGGQVMTQALQAAIAASKVAGALRRNSVVRAAIQSERVGVNR